MPEVVMNSGVTTTVGLEDNDTNQGIHITDYQQQQDDEDHRLKGQGIQTSQNVIAT